MASRPADIEDYSELRFSREQSFFEKSWTIRLVIGAIFIFSLFLFLHFHEIKVDTLELNTIASNYVVAPVDFEFLDEDALAINREKAIRDVGKIYQLLPQEIQQKRIEFENFLIYNQEWRQNTQDATFDEMHRAVDALEKAMTQLRFTDQRTLQKMKDFDLFTEYYLIYTPSDLSQPIQLPTQIWRYLAGVALPKSAYHQGTIALLITFFRNSTWTIVEDPFSQSTLRKSIYNSIPDQYTHISAGTRIVEKNERITTRHLAMMQAMKEALKEKRNLWHPITLAGSLILALLLGGICIIYFHSNYPQVLLSNRKLALIATISILTLIIAKLTELFVLSSPTNAIEMVRYPIFIAFPAILLCSLINAGVATFISGFLGIVLMITLSFEKQGFIIINLTAALVAILNTRSLRRRKEIFIVCAKAWLACFAIILGLNFSQNVLWNSHMSADLLTTGISLLITAIAVIGLLPLIESTFRIMTDVSLIEYLNPNNDLLRRLSIEAPGTYQHSILVGNIAETAALAIGANGLFCRVATLYHDVGKIINPQYFTENQQPGLDVHQLLTPQESASVIIAHVSEGVALARKADLPEQFIDIIKEHHGTSLTYYFYRKQLELVEGDKSKFNETEFRYAGPKPRSKESAIIMIADTLEAASRSLDKLDEPHLMEMAKRLIRDKIEDGQFDECLLTLEELSIITITLVKTIVAYGHSRIKYPTRESTNQKLAPSFEA